MAGELAPQAWGIPVVPDGATRDALWPLATRPQNARVYRVDTGTVERWSGSAWADALQPALPANGRTVATLSAYLINNAVVNVLDYAPVGVTINDGVGDATSAIQAATTAAAGKTLLFPPGGTYLITTEIAGVANLTVVAYGATFLNGTTRLRSSFAFVNKSNLKWYGGTFDQGQSRLTPYVSGDYPTLYNAALYFNGSVGISLTDVQFTNLYTNAVDVSNCNGLIRLTRCDFTSPVQSQSFRCEHVHLASTAGDFIFESCTGINAAPGAATNGVPFLLASGCTGSVTMDKTTLSYCGRDATGAGTTHQLEPIAFYDNCVNVTVTNTRCLNSLYGFVRLANCAPAKVTGFIVTFASVADPAQQTFSIESTGINFLAGSGTVTITGGAGATSFSLSQAGVLKNGSAVAVGNVLYTLSGFNGTTTGTLAGAPNQGPVGFFCQTGGTQASCQEIEISHGTVQEDYSTQRKGVQVGAYDYAVPVQNIRVHDIEFVNIKAMCLLGGPYQVVKFERLAARGLYGGYVSVTANPGGATVTATKGVTEVNSVCTDLVIKNITQDLQANGAIPINIDFTSTHSYTGTIGTIAVEDVDSHMAGTAATQWLVYRGIAGQGRLAIKNCKPDNYTYALDVANVAELTIEGNKARNINPTNFLLASGTIGQTYRRGNRLSGTSAVAAGASSGRAVLVAGTVTVNTKEVVTADNILLTRVVTGGTQGTLTVGAIVDQTSFVITSSNAADTSTIFWEIVH